MSQITTILSVNNVITVASMIGQMGGPSERLPFAHRGVVMGSEANVLLLGSRTAISDGQNFRFSKLKGGNPSEPWSEDCHCIGLHRSVANGVPWLKPQFTISKARRLPLLNHGRSVTSLRVRTWHTYGK